MKGAIAMQFQPSKHGFKFKNGWDGWPLPVELKSIPPPTKTFGLCGGMSAAAWDYFAAKLPIPKFESPPKKGSALFNFLYLRQIHTFGTPPRYIGKFIEWMGRPLNQAPFRGGMDGIRKLTRMQYPHIQRELSEKGFAVIGLVRIKATQSREVWKNHQVLVYSATEMLDPREPSKIGRKIILEVYDPNYPERDNITIECEVIVVGRTLVRGTTIHGFRCVQRVPGSEAKTVRGFFLMKHRRVRPPRLDLTPQI
jgi:hypothetical protein